MYINQGLSHHALHSICQRLLQTNRPAWSIFLPPWMCRHTTFRWWVSPHSTIIIATGLTRRPLCASTVGGIAARAVDHVVGRVSQGGHCYALRAALTAASFYQMSLTTGNRSTLESPPSLEEVGLLSSLTMRSSRSVTASWKSFLTCVTHGRSHRAVT